MFRNGPHSMLNNNIGIVVIGRNEGERLRRCLTSINSFKLRTIYVDSGSTDGSPALANRLGFKVVCLDPGRPFGAARARNEGFFALRHLYPNLQFVQFIDGDCELMPGWLDRAASYLMQHPNIAVVCGRRRERNPQRSLYNKLCDIEWNTPIGQALACGGDSMVRVSAFEAVGGFAPQLIAHEEPEFCYRLRNADWIIWRLDADMSLHDAAMTKFAQWWNRTVRAGYGYAEVSRLHSRTGIRGKETVRAIAWGGVLPFAILLGTVFEPLTLSLILVYPLQVCRIAWRKGPRDMDSWMYAFFAMLAKFSEFYGVMKFYGIKWLHKKVKLIEYKSGN